MADGDVRGDVEALLDYVRRTRDIDFSGYKRTSVVRRITKRMQQLGLTDYSDYVDHLEVHPDEFTAFFDTVLINVTHFFRDAEAWDTMRQLLADRFAGSEGSSRPIRAWSAGTSSGQEAYTIAMLLAEVLGATEFRRRVKVYGTDIDDDALATARRAAYTERDLESVPAELRERYFELVNGEHCFRSDLRRAVIFGRHDLIQDAPISRLDLLVCRNTLMYFNAETQGRVLNRFHFAMADRGLLLMGQAESLLTHGDLFTPVDQKHRIFTSATRGETGRVMSARLFQLANLPRNDHAVVDHDELAQRAVDLVPIPQVVVDASGTVTLMNDMARRLFRASENDVGRAFRDLELSYRPVELRSSIEAAYQERRAIVHHDVEYAVALGQIRYLDVEVMPIFTASGDPSGVSMTFTDGTRHRDLQEELAQSKRRLEEAYEELQSSNEELETTNEELQSTVEELETTNEELQSTNEELETMNEELQSTNDELHVVNEELRGRSHELNKVNAFLESILTGLQRGVVVLDRNLVIEVWNDRSEDLWGLRRDEVVGHPFLTLDIGLPAADVRPVLQKVIRGDEPSIEVAIAARNRRGHPITCVLVASPRYDPAGEVAGALLLMQDRPPEDD